MIKLKLEITIKLFFKKIRACLKCNLSKSKFVAVMYLLSNLIIFIFDSVFTVTKVKSNIRITLT